MAAPASTTVDVKESTPIAKKPSRPHIPALDTIRFFLITYIVVGHFVQFATQNEVVLRLFTQVNVVVGAFFVLSGYMAGYTATEVGKLEASPRLQPAATYIIGRVMGYYHLHVLVSLVFLPMFAYADWYYNGVWTAVAHGVMSFTLTQAWSPVHAELWNAPMWFLSALTFATAPLPAAIAAIARLSRRGLWQCLGALSLTLLVARLAYSYDLSCWSIMEGRLNPRSHPNVVAWNVIRFNPAYALLEMLTGVVAVRFVMLDGMNGEEAAPGWSPVPALLAMVAVLVARAYSALPLNDPLTRSLLFLPLFTAFVVAVHRQTVAGTGQHRLSELLAAGPLTYLGGISFPIFVIHGPLGQLFYKRVIARKVFGSVWDGMGITEWPAWFFYIYLGLVLLSAMILQHGFLNQRAVKDAVSSLTKALCALFQ